MNDKYNLICICESKYYVNLINTFSWPASEFLRIPNVVFGETSENYIPVDYGLQAWKYLMTHNFVNCIKHETKYNFIFMEYNKIINNIRKIETKRGEQNYTWKHEGRNKKKILSINSYQ